MSVCTLSVRVPPRAAASLASSCNSVRCIRRGLVSEWHVQSRQGSSDLDQRSRNRREPHRVLIARATLVARTVDQRPGGSDETSGSTAVVGERPLHPMSTRHGEANILLTRPVLTCVAGQSPFTSWDCRSADSSRPEVVARKVSMSCWAMLEPSRPATSRPMNFGTHCLESIRTHDHEEGFAQFTEQAHPLMVEAGLWRG